MEAGNILICEDERLVARDIQSALERNGYTVAGIASDAEQALKLVQQHAPDLALMDIRLRGSLSGIEIASMLMDEYAVPSIFLTAYADDETLEQAKSSLPLSYLLKPFDEVELKAAVEIGLFRHRQHQRIVSRLQSNIDKLFNADAVEMAVDLEREFLRVERINSNLQVGANIARHIKDELSMVNALVDNVANSAEIEAEHRNALRGALIHQDRALIIVDKLLRCAEKFNLTIEETPIENLARQTMQEMSACAPSNLRFIDCLSPEVTVAAVDRKLVQEALVNVFNNAIQAMPENPEITVSSTLTFEEFPERFNLKAVPGWHVTLKVSDTGRGIAQAHAERIFEPCFGMSTPVSIGLGMCTVHAIMQRHLGWVQVVSGAKIGTTVALHFPLPEPPKRLYSNIFGHA